MLSLHLLQISMRLMVLFQERYQWVLHLHELMVMMRWLACRLQDVQENIFLNNKNHISFNSWHIEWVIIPHLIIQLYIDHKMRESNGSRRMILLLGWLSSLNIKIIRILLMRLSIEVRLGIKLWSHWRSVRNISSLLWIRCLMMFMISCHNIWLSRGRSWGIIWRSMRISMSFWRSFKSDFIILCGFDYIFDCIKW